MNLLVRPDDIILSRATVYYVIKRKTPIIVRYKSLKPQDGETFFYQQLLLTNPCRSETELLGDHITYRARFLSLHPNFQQTLANQTTATNLTYSWLQLV
jgi:hypothetical protein